MPIVPRALRRPAAPSPRVGRLAIALLATLAGCASPFRLDVRADPRGEVSSLYVLVAPQSELPAKPDVEEIDALLAVDRTGEYVAYAQVRVLGESFEVPLQYQGARVLALTALEATEDAAAPRLRIALRRSVFDAFPDAALALVVQAGTLKWKRFSRAQIESTDALLVELSSEGLEEVVPAP